MKSKTVPVAMFVPQPVLTSVTPSIAGALTQTYKIVGVAADGTLTQASTAVSTNTGSTLDATHFNTLVWTDPLNAASVQIFRTAGGPSQGLIGTVAAGVQTFADTGFAGDSSTPSATNGTGVGTDTNVSDMSDLTVEVSGTFTATLQLQGRIDPDANWDNLGNTLSTAGFVDVSATAKTLSHIRVKMTAFTSGTPVVSVAGH